MLILFIVLFSLFLLVLFSKPKNELYAHWNHLLDDFKYSTKDFYAQLKTELESRGIENVKISEKSISESGVFSSNRLYLRIKWKEYVYDCCCAPFGTGTFISWWLFGEQSKRESMLAKIPFIGNWLLKLFFPVTYYKIDTASMFMTYAQSSVLKVITDITQEKGVRALTQEEKKPIMKDIFSRQHWN